MNAWPRGLKDIKALIINCDIEDCGSGSRPFQSIRNLRQFGESRWISVFNQIKFEEVCVASLLFIAEQLIFTAVRIFQVSSSLKWWSRDWINCFFMPLATKGLSWKTWWHSGFPHIFVPTESLATTDKVHRNLNINQSSVCLIHFASLKSKITGTTVVMTIIIQHKNESQIIKGKLLITETASRQS